MSRWKNSLQHWDRDLGGDRSRSFGSGCSWLRNVSVLLSREWVAARRRRVEELVRSPFADLDGSTGWLRFGSYQRDHFFMVLPDEPAATAPVVTWSSNALLVTPMFPSLRSYLAGFAAAIPLWTASPLATDDDGLVALSVWWEPVTGYDSETPIEGLEPALRALIEQEDARWPLGPSPLWKSPEMADPSVVEPYWLRRLRITPQPRPRR